MVDNLIETRMIQFIVLLGLFCLGGAYEVCSTSNFGYNQYYTYCEGNTYCCHDDTECCKSLTGGQIAGIVVGIGFLISLCVGCVVCCCRKNRRQPPATMGMQASPSAPTVSYIASPGGQPQVNYGAPPGGQPQVNYGAPPTYSQAAYSTGPYPQYPAPYAHAPTSEAPSQNGQYPTDGARERLTSGVDVHVISEAAVGAELLLANLAEVAVVQSLMLREETMRHHFVAKAALETLIVQPDVSCDIAVLGEQRLPETAWSVLELVYTLMVLCVSAVNT
ncbi:hypothetical protein MAR_009016 [Mya arenaria]|uniref:Uncharacterized protein n=1 Tax=Mya arenaria TaxID=6604 RepID=A0ABY7DXM2_MYAAR|nr:hypothetical protein MAR_009016 [Mya arenaria]